MCRTSVARECVERLEIRRRTALRARRVRQGALRRGIFGRGIENAAYSGQRTSDAAHQSAERAPGQRHRSSSKRSAKSLSHGVTTRETVAWFRQKRHAGEQFLSPAVKGTGRNQLAEKLKTSQSRVPETGAKTKVHSGRRVERLTKENE